MIKPLGNYTRTDRQTHSEIIIEMSCKEFDFFLKDGHSYSVLSVQSSVNQCHFSVRSHLSSKHLSGTQYEYGREIKFRAALEQKISERYREGSKRLSY